jgi:hypothetical protein
MPSSRTVSLSYAKAILPALFIGYLIPTIAIYLPYKDDNTTKDTTQLFVAVWQTCPLYVNAILAIISTFISSGSSPKKLTTTSDLPYLHWVYGTIIVTGLVVHLGTIASFLKVTDDPNYTFRHAFLLAIDDTFFSVPRDLGNFPTAMLKIFQWDFWVIFAASLVWAWQGLWDLNRVGLAKVNLTVAAITISLGSVLLGPATVLGVVWYYREEKMANTDAIKEKSKRY